MPRKKWIPKNKYCKRSKLDSSEFGALVSFYFHEALFGASRDVYWHNFIITCEYNDALKRDGKIDIGDDKSFLYVLMPGEHTEVSSHFKQEYKKEGVGFLTKETISTYFNRISQYIWEKGIVNKHPAFKEEDVFDDLLDLIYEKTEKISSYKELYFNVLNKFPLYLNENNITGSLMFYLLSKRSKTIRGFKKETFYLEFSRVYFICAVIEANNIEIKSIYSTEETGKLHEILEDAKSVLLTNLEKTPM